MAAERPVSAEPQAGEFFSPSSENYVPLGARDEGKGLDDKDPHITPAFQELLSVLVPYLGEVQRIYVPAAGTDTTPSAAYPDASVLYAEMDLAKVAAMQQAGFNTIRADINNAVPVSPADLVLLFETNGQREEIDVVPLAVRQGGYVVDRHWTPSAPRFMTHPDFSLVGVVRRVRDEQGQEVLLFDTTATKETYLAGQKDEKGNPLKHAGDEAFVFQRVIAAKEPPKMEKTLPSIPGFAGSRDDTLTPEPQESK